jgi:hypothetical protein
MGISAMSTAIILIVGMITLYGIVVWYEGRRMKYWQEFLKRTEQPPEEEDWKTVEKGEITEDWLKGLPRTGGTCECGGNMVELIIVDSGKRVLPVCDQCGHFGYPRPLPPKYMEDDGQ